MIIIDYLRGVFQRLLGVDVLMKNIEDLRRQNKLLATHVIDHQKTIGLIAVTHARNLRDLLAIIDELSGKRKDTHLSTNRQKDDDDIVN